MSSATDASGRKIAHVPNDLLLRARAQRLSPTGSGRSMSRREVADELNRYLSRPIDGNYYGRIERGEVRWPGRELREALCRMFGATTEAELGLFIDRRQPSVARARNVVSVGADLAPVPVAGRTLLWQLLAQRHLQTPDSFRVQFERAATSLADREGNPTLSALSVSSRQVRRWLDGTRPRPDACRVLESMFGHPIGRLLRPAVPEPGHGSTHTPHGLHPIAALRAAENGSVPAVSPVEGDSLVVGAVEVSVSPGTAITIICDRDHPARVAVLAGTVRIVIESSAATAPRNGSSVTTAASGPPRGDAQVYSIAQRRGSRSAGDDR
jgi:hypothetical protein